jgi:hypothetical protein
MRVQLRQRAYSDPHVSELARDVQQHIDMTPVTRLLEVTAQYQEPMTLSLPREPKGLLCVRARQDSSPETAVTHGAPCSYTWEQQGVTSAGRVKINDIDGLSAGTTYRLTFLVIYG